MLDELGVKKIIELIPEDDEVRNYLPDSFFNGKRIDRTFLFNTINTVCPGYLDELIGYANRQREGFDAGPNQEENILATDEWIAELQAIPFSSKVSFQILFLICFL